METNREGITNAGFAGKTTGFSQLMIQLVSRLKQSGFNESQIADDVLIPLSEVEEILQAC